MLVVVVLPVPIHHRGGLRGRRVVRHRPRGTSSSPSGGCRVAGGGGRGGGQVEAGEVLAKVGVPAGPAAVGEVGFPLEPGQRQSGPAVQRGPAQNVRSRGGAAVGVTAHCRSVR